MVGVGLGVGLEVGIGVIPCNTDTYVSLPSL